jgi:hypothetical protein
MSATSLLKIRTFRKPNALIQSFYLNACYKSDFATNVRVIGKKFIKILRFIKDYLPTFYR